MRPQLLTQIFTGAWAMDRQEAAAYLAQLPSIIQGNGISQETTWAEARAALRPYDFAVAADSGGRKVSTNGSSSEPEFRIRVINLKGPMLKDDEPCGPLGTESIARYIRDAANSGDYDGMIIKVDSGGGQFNGTKNLMQAVIEATAKMPVVAWISNGTMASAAYYACCGAHEIIASQDTDRIGSIGVMCTIPNFSGAYEKIGVVLHEFYADQSVDKNADYRAVLAGDYEPMKQSVLNRYAAEFIADVQAARGSKLSKKENVLTGKVYMADDSHGLIDSIGNFDYAVQRVMALHDQLFSKNSNSKNSNRAEEMADTKLSFKQRFGLIAAALGFTELQATNQGATLATNDLDRLEASLSESQQTISSQSDQIATLTAELNATRKERDDWKAKANEYGSQPGVLPKKPVRDGKTAEDTSGTRADTWNDDELPWNQAADNSRLRV